MRFRKVGSIYPQQLRAESYGEMVLKEGSFPKTLAQPIPE